MGFRFPKGGRKIIQGAMPWKHRWIGNPTLSRMGRFHVKSPVVDFHYGMRTFTQEAYRRMGLRTKGIEFASETVIKATLQGRHIGD